MFLVVFYSAAFFALSQQIAKGADRAFKSKENKHIPGGEKANAKKKKR